MMISPEAYASMFENADYLKLMKERDRLIAALRKFEKKERAGDRSGDEWMIMPSPAVIYQMNLEYLAAICQLMHQKYNSDYVFGDRKLSEEK